MSLSVQDGFDFSMGVWLADITRLGIGLVIVMSAIGVGYGLFALYDWIRYRRDRE